MTKAQNLHQRMISERQAADETSRQAEARKIIV